MKRLLIIEDDAAVAAGLETALKNENYEVSVESDGEKGFEAGKNKDIDLIILDLMLPNKNGLEICKDLRKMGLSTPILMLTVKSEEVDKVLGLEIGADDYVIKPYSLRELLARIKAIMRRRGDIVKDFESFNFSDVTVDFKKMEAEKRNKLLEMSFKEFEILKYFISHEGEVISRNQLLDKVWGYDVFPTTRTVDNYILMIRKKIEDNPSVPKHLLTMHSAGYKFVK